jgi:hypothetical protein
MYTHTHTHTNKKPKHIKKKNPLFTVKSLSSESVYFQGLLIKWSSSKQASKHRGQSSLSDSRTSPRVREGLQWQRQGGQCGGQRDKQIKGTTRRHFMRDSVLTSLLHSQSSFPQSRTGLTLTRGQTFDSPEPSGDVTQEP